MDFADANVLITGGAGFIGANLARRLVNEGADVTIIDSLIPEYGGNLANLEGIRDKIHLNIADVRDPHAMRQLVQGRDFLFNLAGQTSHMDSMSDPFTDLDINAKAQLSILEACRAQNPAVKIVFAGTRQIYGRPDYLPVDEAHPIRPVDINGIHKVAGEWYHTLYTTVYGVQSTVLRLTNTYGPCMRIKDARQTFVGVWCVWRWRASRSRSGAASSSVILPMWMIAWTLSSSQRLIPAPMGASITSAATAWSACGNWLTC